MPDPQIPVQTLWSAFDARRFRDALEALAPDFEALWPQTRELIRGAEGFVALNEAYPGQWRCRLQRLEPISDTRVAALVEISNAFEDGSGERLFAVGFYDVEDGKIVRAEEYFADCAEPPFDRSEWAERY